MLGLPNKKANVRLTPTEHFRFHRGLALLIALLWLAAACSNGGSADAAPDNANSATDRCVERTGDRITVYSGRSESLMGTVLDSYECLSGNVVDVRWGSTTELALLLGEEGDRSPADVFLSRSPGAIGFLQSKDLLQPLNQAVLNLVSPENRSSTGHWVGFSGRKRVLVYNVDNTATADLPDSVFELTQEQYRNRVAIPGSNGSFVDWFTVLRVQQGDDVATTWINEMVANGARYYPNNRSIVDAVGRGEIDFGLVNHYYNYQQAEANGASHRAENHQLGEDDIGALVLITAAAVTAHTEKVEIANQLVAHLLAEESQRFFTDSSLEYPIAAGVEPNQALPELNAPVVGSIGLDDLGAGFERTTEIIEQSGILQR